MYDPAPHALLIEPIRPSLRRAALQLFFRDLDPAEQDREIEFLLRRPKVATDTGLLGVIHQAEVLGVVWAQMQPGRTATIWPPQLRQYDDQLGRKLARAAVERARCQGATFVQAQVAPDELQAKAWLEGAGLRRIANMECLSWQAPGMDCELRFPPLPRSLALRRYAHPVQRPLLEQMLMQTWIGTLDCPALEGLRNSTDAVEGYMAAGDSGAEHWYFLCHGEDDAGCLLLADHSEDDEMELVYLGLAPPWRGRGLGHVLIQCAQQVTHRAGRRSLTTAVDSANVPACAVYDAAGFFRFDRREIMMLWFV